MNDETVFPTEVQDSVPSESAAVETEGSDQETTAPTQAATEPEESIPETTGYFVPDVTDAYWESLPEVTEVEETVLATTEAVVEVIDYTPALAEATSIIANIILCGCLMIVGTLCGIRFWR